MILCARFAADRKIAMSEELLCIDTNVMIWGILQNGKTEREKRMIEKASSFFENGFNDGKIFAISVITLSEFMVRIPPEERDPYLELISKNFVLIPYSENAALKNADIFRNEYLKMKSKYHGMRGILRPDMQILASAVVFGNVTLITEDEAFRELAEKYIPVSPIPELPPEQPPLF